MASVYTILFLSFLPVAISISSPPAPPPDPAPSPPSDPPRNYITSPPPAPAPSAPISMPPSQDGMYGPSPSRPEPPPSPPAQVDNIIDALIGSGDFGNWIDLLMAAGNDSSLPVSATLFVPDDVALPQPKNHDPRPNQVGLDPFLFAYHTVPIRLTFADLRARVVGSRIPTLLPGNSLLITNNSFSNFTIDDSPISHPDLYLSGKVSVHGIVESFDYKRFGTENSKPNSKPLPERSVPQSAPPRPLRAPPSHKRPGFTFLPGPVGAGTRNSGSNFFFCSWIPLVFGFCIIINTLLSSIR